MAIRWVSMLDMDFSKEFTFEFAMKSHGCTKLNVMYTNNPDSMKLCLAEFKQYLQDEKADRGRLLTGTSGSQSPRFERPGIIFSSTAISVFVSGITYKLVGLQGTLSAARLVTDPSPSRAIALRPSFAAPSSPVLPVARLFVHLPAGLHRPSPLPEGLPIAGPPAVAARRRSPELLRLVRHPVLESPSTAPLSPLPSPWSSPVRNPPPILLPLLPYGHRPPLPHVARACADAHQGAPRSSPCSGHRGPRLSWPCSAPAADLWPRTASPATPNCSAFLASPPGAGAVAPPVPCPAAGSGERPIRWAAPSARPVKALGL
nr:SH3 domain-containing protein C23A1.17-like [Aegilops tauschii subsp. strangulata]